MSRARRLCFVISLSLLAVYPALSASAAEPAPPEITAQGFDIDGVQGGVLGDFERLRVRFEVPARIESLKIRERSFEVDLASTPEREHLPLFGLARQVRQLVDVTLDFRPYVNEKIREMGAYEFELLVTDRRGRSASAVLKIRVDSAPPADAVGGSAALEVGTFEFVRRGASPVTGTEDFGIAWITVDGNRVVIELKRTSDDDGMLFELDDAAYEQLVTRAELRGRAENSRGLPSLKLSAAGNGAAGTVFGVLHDQLPAMLRVTGSRTALSEIGTTVTLHGEFKK